MAADRTRRQFLAMSAAGASLAIPACAEATNPPHAAFADASRAIPRRPLGKTGVQVSILGMGGSHLGDVTDPNVAVGMVHEAVDAGINFFDNAWEYHDGRSEEVLGRALRGGWRDRVFLM